ncbi:type II toxin-antitoxin system RelE/ParE family toxin [Leucobacter sp. HY1910]
MSFTLVVHPEAAEELNEAIAWYEQGGQHRGVAFEAAVDRLIDHCLAWPRSGEIVPVPETERVFRHARIPRSRYRLIYSIIGQRFAVLAFAHESRMPLYWASRG